MDGKENISVYFDGKHYDSYLCSLGLEEYGLSFYLNQCKKYGGEVLEIGCGTGRITIPIAEEGFLITGLDNSSPFLELAAEKAKDKNLSIKWENQSMASFDLNRKFDLILLTGNTFLHLLELKDLENCISCVIMHLKKEGRFIFDSMKPWLQGLMTDPKDIAPHAEYPNPYDDSKVNIKLQKSFDIASQIQTHIYHYTIGEKKVKRIAKFRITFPKDLDAILHYNGLSIEEKYGSFSKEPFTSDSLQQIFICKIAN